MKYSPQTPELIMHDFRRMFGEKRLEECIRYGETALIHCGEHMFDEIYSILGDSYLGLDDFPNAEKNFELSLLYSRGDVDIWNKLLYAVRVQGDYIKLKILEEEKAAQLPNQSDIERKFAEYIQR